MKNDWQHNVAGTDCNNIVTKDGRKWTEDGEEIK